MTRLQQIESQLIAINDSVFQELCDKFLVRKHENYKVFSRSGSQAGKQKTTRGTPDSFFLLPNGKYLFVEHSTNISAGVKKLTQDIQKCLDESKTGIPVSEISEIIICINFKLGTSEIKQLQDPLRKVRIALEVYTLDLLALELSMHHRDLVHEYLGLALDTGQVVSLDTFVRQYNRKSGSIATTLSNPLFHRQTEKQELHQAIQHSDLVILTGPAGVGKTKLAIEVIRDFVTTNPSYEAHSISYKGASLLEDLYQHLDLDKDHLLLVDDANRMDTFIQIIGFYQSDRRGSLKILITVRDYAFSHIKERHPGFTFSSIHLSKLSDDQIKDIIESQPFEILNHHYQQEITRIAEGNPRLAIMSALLAKETQNIFALRDVSDLFESYFQTFVRDQKELADLLAIKALGLTAFFHTFPYQDRESALPILQDFGIDYYQFSDMIDKLETLELLEVQYGYAKIPEQNLATYFFYRAFIKDDLLSFDTLLQKYFVNNQRRFKDSVVSANNSFGPNKVMDKLRPSLATYWQAIESNPDLSFQFLESFWYYLPQETLAFIYEFIESLPNIPNPQYQIPDNLNNITADHDKIIGLLSNFFTYYHQHLKDAIELSLVYVRRVPEKFPTLIDQLNKQFAFNPNDELSGFYRQHILFDLLIDGLSKNDELSTTLFYELSKTFLHHQFESFEGRKGRIVIYPYTLILNEYSQQFREKLWKVLDTHFQSYFDKSLGTLKGFSQIRPDVVPEILTFDTPFLIEIINKHLSPSHFEHCLYVQKHIAWSCGNQVAPVALSELAQKFTNPTYEIYLKVNWDEIWNRREYSIDEYDRKKRADIRANFTFTSHQEVLEFYTIYDSLHGQLGDAWWYNQVLDIIVDENLLRDFGIGSELIELITKNGNPSSYVPSGSFQNHLGDTSKAARLWSLIVKHQFQKRLEWLFTFFYQLDPNLINASGNNGIPNLDILLLELKQAKGNEVIKIQFRSLTKYLSLRPNLFEELLRIITERNEEQSIKIWISSNTFSDHFEQLGQDLSLIKRSYLWHYQHQSHFDFQHEGLFEILRLHPDFLLEFVSIFYSPKDSRFNDTGLSLGKIWQISGIESQIQKTLDFIASNTLYFGISEYFFKRLNQESQGKADDFLLEYLKNNFQDKPKVDMIINITHTTRKNLFEQVLLTYLSLNQDKEAFESITWTKSGVVIKNHSTTFGDIEAANWRNILEIISKSHLGIELLPIRKYIQQTMDTCQKRARQERQREFIQNT